MYVNPNFKTKKELKLAVTRLDHGGCPGSCHSCAMGEFIDVFQPGLGMVPRDGRVSLEGPHYPAAHTWYAEGTMKNGVLIAVK